MRRRWTKIGLLVAIRELKKQGIALIPAEVKQTPEGRKIFYSAKSPSHFGSWEAAVEAAGFSYARIKRARARWSRRRVVKELRKAFEAGEDLLSEDFKRKHPQLVKAILSPRVFGSWRKALQAAKLDYETVRRRHFWTREKVLATLSAIAERGEPLNYKHVQANYPGLYRAARRPELFGSWKAALQAAGLQSDARSYQRWTKARIVEEIRRLARSGHRLSQSEVLVTFPALVAAAKSKYHFGSWQAAVEAAGFDYNAHRRRRPKSARQRRRKPSETG